MACDLSGYRNHGVPFDVAAAVDPYAPGLTYASGDSRVIVSPNQSLQDLIAVRAVVSFYLDPSEPETRRYNLMEGHLCFALFVNPDGSLSGTIVDAEGEWAGAQSQPHIVSSGRWHQAELRHDGVNQCSLYLDSVPVATSYTASGPVGSVGPNGIAIGHWPEPSGQYTFAGHLREARVYKYDPAQAAQGLLDPCCSGSREALDDIAQQLRAAGYTRERAREQGMELIKFGLSVSAQVRGNDAVRSQEQVTVTAQALAAFLHGDANAYTTAVASLAATAVASLSEADQQEIRDRQEELVNGLPLPIKQFQGLLDHMCLGKTKVNPKAVVDAVSRAMKAERNPKNTRK